MSVVYSNLFITPHQWCSSLTPLVLSLSTTCVG